MPWIGPAISSVAGVAGNMISSAGAANANTKNAEIAYQIAQQQMQFQRESQQESERYDTEMSNTAVQRRKADLVAAGINPLLAAGNAASSPEIGSLPGSSVTPTMQNASASWSNLGQQTAQALALRQTAATTANIEMDTKRKQAELPYAGPQAAQQLDFLTKQTNNLQQQWENLLQENHLTDAQVKNADYSRKLMEQNYKFNQGMNELLQQAEKLDIQRVQYGMSELKNSAGFHSSGFGQFLDSLGLTPNHAIGAIGSAVGAATHAYIP